MHCEVLDVAVLVSWIKDLPASPDPATDVPLWVAGEAHGLLDPHGERAVLEQYWPLVRDAAGFLHDYDGPANPGRGAIKMR